MVNLFVMTIENAPNILILLKQLLSTGTPKQYHAFLNRFHEADIAEALDQLRMEDREAFFTKVKPDLAAEILEEMPIATQSELISELKIDLAAQYIEEMESDDAVDLLEELLEDNTSQAEQIIQALSPADQTEIIELMSYPEDSAGSIMSPEIIALPEDLTIEEGLDAIKKKNPPDSEVSFYIFITNKDEQLIGVTSLRNILLADPKESIRSIRDDSPIKVHVNQDKEEVSKIIQKYDLIALPVVDDEDKLLGLITVDDVVDVVVEEANEDFHRLSGTTEYDESKLLSGKISHAISSRVPWLILTVLGGILASYIITDFSTTLQTSYFNLALCLSFVPLLMGLGGNVGNQSATIIVRGISMGLVKAEKPLHYIGRETLIGFSIGVIIGLFLFLTNTYILSTSPLLTYIVSISLIINITVATFIGSALPLLLNALKLDPAVACAPVISTSLDIVGQLIYFSLTLYVVQLLV